MGKSTFESNRSIATAAAGVFRLRPGLGAITLWARVLAVLLTPGWAVAQNCQGQCDGLANPPASVTADLPGGSNSQTARARLAARLHEIRRRRARRQDAVAAVGVDFVQNVFRAQDGTVYQLLRTVPIAAPTEAEEYRITQVAGGPLGLRSCVAHGTTMFAGVGTDPSIPQVLWSLNDTLRTRLIAPSDVREVRFDGSGAGRLTLGTGAATARVCLRPADCPDSDSEALVPLSSPDGGAPPACIASGVVASCAGGWRDTWAFGLAADGFGNCNAAPTADATLCEARPADGIALHSGEAIVFVYSGGIERSDFTVGAAGFGIDTDNTNIGGCQPSQVVSSVAVTAGVPACPFRP